MKIIKKISHIILKENYSDILKVIADEADLSDDSRSALNSAIEEFKKSGLAS